MRTVTTYDRITAKGVKTVPCAVCGKRIRRQHTFGQTVNPFNKNPDGTVKTAAEVHTAVLLQAHAWETRAELWLCTTHKEVPA